VSDSSSGAGEAVTHERTVDHIDSGPKGSHAPGSAGAGAAIFLGALVLFMPWLGAREIETRAEARIPLVALDIIRTGRILPPHLLGEPYLNKPPLHHLLAAAAIRAFGGRHDEWTVRLPSVLCGAATIWLTWLLGARLAGSRAGLFAAAFLFLSYRFFSLARSTELEILLTAATTLSYLGLARVLWGTPSKPGQAGSSGWWLAAAGAAIASLTKGPLLALLFPFVLLVADAIVRRSARPLASAGPLILLLGAIAGTAVYYGPLVVEFGGVSALWKRLTLENVLHAHGFHYYFWQLPLGLLPAGLALPWMLKALRRAGPVPRACALAVAIGLVVFSLSPSKQSHYLLPLYPLVGVWAATSGVFDRWRVRPTLAVVAVAGALMVAWDAWEPTRGPAPRPAGVMRDYAAEARGRPLGAVERNPMVAYYLDRPDLEFPDGPEGAVRFLEDRGGFLAVDLEKGERLPDPLAGYEIRRTTAAGHTYVLLHKGG
jgi:4-amino-4-deoxy-L-arabinose transferase-like glycosyltransferase